MKKLLALILALCLIFALAACGEEQPEPAVQEDPAIQNAPAETEQPEAEDAATDTPQVSGTPLVEEKAPEEPAETAPASDAPEKQQSADSNDRTEEPKGEAVVLEPAKNTDLSVADYVKNHGEEFAQLFADNYASSTGSTCICSIQAQGSRMILKLCITSLEDLPEDLRASMQTAYDILGTSYKDMFIPVKEVCSELSGVRIEFCEKDGDLIAGVDIEL